jgi:uncharacterized protein (TIGR02646 family)
MIRVRRPATVPAVLRTRGAAATATHCAAYDAAPDDYAKGKATFSFNPRIYRAKEVKVALRKAQHDKCCFCESKVTHISPGDIEHFRPKAAFRQSPGGPLQRPGYFWLAYEWSNLFFCCQLCNQRFKQNLFPLRRASSRARSRHDDLAAEQPLLINPEEDPTPFLRFRQEYLHPVRRNRRGRVTIDALGLNQTELVEERRKHLTIVRRLREVRALLQQDIRQKQEAGVDPPAGHREQLAKLNDLLTEMTRDAAEYAAMTRAALADA